MYEKKPNFEESSVGWSINLHGPSSTNYHTFSIVCCNDGKFWLCEKPKTKQKLKEKIMSTWENFDSFWNWILWKTDNKQKLLFFFVFCLAWLIIECHLCLCFTQYNQQVCVNFCVFVHILCSFIWSYLLYSIQRFTIDAEEFIDFSSFERNKIRNEMKLNEGWFCFFCERIWDASWMPIDSNWT